MKLWRSSLVWVCSCPALTSPIPSNWNYSVPLLQGRWTLTPKYSMASHWQCPRSLVQLWVEKLEQTFAVVSVSSWFYILTAVITECSQKGFWGARCCQDPALATGTELGGKGLPSPGSQAGNAQRLLWGHREFHWRSSWHLWDLATSSTKQLLNGVLPIFLWSKCHHLTLFLLSNYSVVSYTIKSTEGKREIPL